MPATNVVAFSGGIDSQAVALHLRRLQSSTPLILLFCDTGNENPLTLDFVANYSAKVHPVRICTPEVGDLGDADRAARRREELPDNLRLTMLDLAVLKGRFPSPTRRFCTQYLKLEPMKRWIRQNVDPDFELWLGIRADESSARAKQPVREWSELHDCHVNRPLLYWTKEQCFKFVLGAGEDINPLYRMGFARVGCSPCIMYSKDQIRTWAYQCPNDVEKIRAWEAQTGRYYFGQVLPGKRMGPIDEVIKWSRTAHGGKRNDLPLLEQQLREQSCTSIYGLCE